ncbi:MAG TPA: LacI family DNA-binding transcriptional regulator [Longimicrobiales bacterium]
MKKPTIVDVAARAGVSKSTVSAVINNKDVVSESTRRAVLQAIEELNYRPNPAARRGFRPLTSKSIHFIVKEAPNPYYAEALAGIQEVAGKKGYLVSVSSSDGRSELEKQIVEQCMEREVGGLIIAPIRDDDSDLSHIFELKRHNIPFVLLENVRGIRANLVDVDNVKASSEAVKYLIEQGHSRIVHFAGPRYSEHSQERAEGVRRAFSESHLVFDESMIVHAGDSPEDGYRTGLEYFRGKGKERPTAVTCYNDLVALGLLRALRELGIRVPEEVSVIGFDDLRILAYFPLALTTVHVPKYEMGKRAAEMLIRQIESSKELPVEKVLLEAKLMIRDSTRPLGPERDGASQAPAAPAAPGRKRGRSTPNH